MVQRYSFATILVGRDSLRSVGIARVLRSANVRILASLSCADGLLTRKVKSCPLMFLIVGSDDDFDATAEQIELVKNRYPDARIAVVTGRYRLNELVAAFRAGATGYFADAMSCDAFIKSIELVVMGEAVFPRALLFALGANEATVEKIEPVSDRDATIEAPEDPLVQGLSPRERSILRCLIEGASNKCIARKIDITEATVKVHIKAILRKIRVQNRTQAAIWAINNRCQKDGPSSGVVDQASRTEMPRLGELIRKAADLGNEVTIRSHKYKAA